VVFAFGASTESRRVHVGARESLALIRGNSDAAVGERERRYENESAEHARSYEKLMA
jgi:hypothetical protein